ncbi:glycine zipper 2TM domain-containing protein [Sphingomonas sp. S1-29]|uniref:glycine zipper 2TM domain-containing protein n=1 Tax=Sphingomonas sp. S1-29 TaxID=2991074 RepID=UPI002240BEB0|nr:glycine zipper 2TM domain-containing protein [Sphingomonas sp. S1-29]UZK68122.1 glycine zipper 2TM domain-containing protein [Sphingomonas sp. S1-29]
MFKKLSIATAAIAMGATSLVAPTVASAAPIAIAAAPTAMTAASFDAGVTDYQRYRDRDRRYYGNRNNNRRQQRCSSTEGTVIGAVAGGLLGNTVAGNGNRLLGTVIGGGAGALAGREIDRSGQPRRCARNR